MSQNSTLFAGYGQAQITPPIGMHIPGRYAKRYSEGKITDLYVRSVALSYNDTSAFIFMIDALTITCKAYEEITDLICTQFNVPKLNIYLHATHIHTGFDVKSPSESEEDAHFYQFIYTKLSDCARTAFADLAPTTMSISTGEAKNIAFTRRYLMKDGSVKTNPPVGDPNIVKRVGLQDESVQLIRLTRENAAEILLINFGTHPDVIGGTKYCFDWPGYTVEFTKNAFEEEKKVLLLNGCQGDSNHCDRYLPEGTKLGGLRVSKKMARVLTGEVLKIYDNAVPITVDGICAGSTTAIIGKNDEDYTEDDIPLARIVRKAYEKAGRTDTQELEEYRNQGMSVPKATRILKNLKAPEKFNIPLYGLRIGPIVLLGIPGEPFSEIGMKIKKLSAYAMTFVNCCTNGYFDYIPTKEAYDAVGGYEREHSQLHPNCSEVIIESAKEILERIRSIHE